MRLIGCHSYLLEIDVCKLNSANKHALVVVWDIVKRLRKDYKSAQRDELIKKSGYQTMDYYE